LRLLYVIFARHRDWLVLLGRRAAMTLRIPDGSITSDRSRHPGRYERHGQRVR
jgi:hypothetical protein